MYTALLAAVAPSSRVFRRGEFLATVLGVLLHVPTLWAFTSGSEYKFQSAATGEEPTTGLVADGSGNFYGTTLGGGISNESACMGGGFPGYTCGTIFKAARDQGGRWTETVIYEFTGGTDGAFPSGSLTLDEEGNLYGTTQQGGVIGCTCGTVFELTSNQDGSWAENTLYNFQGGADGYEPVAGVVFDALGNLYGTTSGGGSSLLYGTAFKLTPNQIGQWTKSVIYNFQGDSSGSSPGAVVFDSAGNLDGMVSSGGLAECKCGAVYQLTPSPTGTWTQTILHSFTGQRHDGAIPSEFSRLTFDAAGNIYGDAMQGGDRECACGIVFQLHPNSDGSWTEQVLHIFHGPDGREPVGGEVFDSEGNLYGTTGSGGQGECYRYGCGTIFELTSTRSGVSFRPVASFYKRYGTAPVSGVIVDTSGHLYGTAAGGGISSCYPPYGCGAVFEIKP